MVSLAGFDEAEARGASTGVALLCIAGTLSAIYLVGPQQVYWLYPTVVAVFFLVRPREALACALLAMLASLPRLIPTYSTAELATLTVTICITCALAYGFSLTLYRQRRRLDDLATRDPLTGAGNRRGLAGKLKNVVNNFNRTYTPSSIVLLNIDNLEEINDVHGRAVGDQVLQTITEIINLRIRVTDSLYRIGGEEFAVLLEGADLHHASHLAEQLRTLVDANELVRDPGVVPSIGIAELRDNETNYEWLRRAQEAMHRTRNTGREAVSLSA